MVEVFRDVRRVLRNDGTLWLNLGDSYANDGKWGGETSGKQAYLDDSNRKRVGREKRMSGLKPKDLCGIPWRVAFALQADGWWLRQDIIWSKLNPMPESVTDRCTKSHEYLFLLSKSERYYYDADAIKEQCSNDSHGSPNINPGSKNSVRGDGGSLGKWTAVDKASGRNKRSVWEIATAPFSEAHFATFPPALVEPCIKAGASEKGCCSKCGAQWARETERIDKGWDGSRYGERVLAAAGGAKDGGTARSTLGSGNGKLVGSRETIGWFPSCSCNAEIIPCTVLDPFAGAGTTGLVADRLNRNAILIELNSEYVSMAEHRLRSDAPLFAEVSTVGS